MSFHVNEHEKKSLCATSTRTWIVVSGIDTNMESITHTLKALILFWLGLNLKSFVPSQFNFFLGDTVYNLALIWLVFRFYMSYTLKALPQSDFRVCIIGAGFSGIAMAIKLKQLGVKFRIVEKSEHLGGTWWRNQYPGCGCDLPSHIYRYVRSFVLAFTMGNPLLPFATLMVSQVED